MIKAQAAQRQLYWRLFMFADKADEDISSPISIPVDKLYSVIHTRNLKALLPCKIVHANQRRREVFTIYYSLAIAVSRDKVS